MMADSGFFTPYLRKTAEYHIQILYSKITRDEEGKALIETHTYGIDTASYFFPASMVKLPCSALALEKLNRLNLPNLDKESVMHSGAEFRCQTPEKSRDTALFRRPSLANYIRRMMLVSDNVAYNRSYEFLGPDYIKEQLTLKGYPTARIIQRFAGCDREANRRTNPAVFLNPVNWDTLYRQPGKRSASELRNPNSKPYLGHAHLDFSGKRYEMPYDFSHSNHLLMADVHNMVISLMLPEAVHPNQRFDMSTNDLAFLKKYMGMYPRESGMPEYSNHKVYYDSYKKYLVFGRGQAVIPDSIRIYNIVGMAQGFLADCAYITEPANNVEFFLSALIYTNADGVLNDGIYEYNTLGQPFLKRLGLAFLNYERERQKLEKSK
ncbi:MAG: serine hydrolase [Bacteroidota bacterium]